MDELACFFGAQCDKERNHLAPVPPFRRRQLDNEQTCRVHWKENPNLLLKAVTTTTLPENISLFSDTFGVSPDKSYYSLPPEAKSSKMPKHLPPEIEAGNIEYKRTLVNPSRERFEHLVTQMKWRLNEGGGQAIYRLGVDDDGRVSGLRLSDLAASLTTIHRMAQNLNAKLQLLRECIVKDELISRTAFAAQAVQPPRKAVELLVRRLPCANQGLPDARIAVLGRMDSGKSTLLGVLTDGEWDNGRGRARLNLFRHPHEVQTGRTSSLSTEVIGFDANGHLLNYDRLKGRLHRRTADEVYHESKSLITLMDLAGHPKYQRTTLYGLTQGQPMLALLVVSATTGLSADGVDHARTAIALGLPIAVVVSKIDLLADATVDSIAALVAGVLTRLHQLRLMQPPIEPSPVGDENFDPASTFGHVSTPCLLKDPPVFPISCVTGEGISALLRFLSRVSVTECNPTVPIPYWLSELSISSPTDLPPPVDGNSAHVRFWIGNVYRRIPGIDLPVVGGLLRSGELCEGQKLWLGPFKNGIFSSVRVVELRRNRQPHQMIREGQVASLAIDLQSSAAGPRHVNTWTAASFSRSWKVVADDVNAYSDAELVANCEWKEQLRRGMVLVSQCPVSSEQDTTKTQPDAATCWTISVKNLVCLPNAPCQPLLPPVKYPVFVFGGNVYQLAKVVSHSSSRWSQSDKNVDVATDSLMYLSSEKLVIRFIRQVEFMERGRQVVITWAPAGRAVGYVDELLDCVSVLPNSVGSADNMEASCKSESNWKSVGFNTHSLSMSQGNAKSLEMLFSLVGISTNDYQVERMPNWPGSTAKPDIEQPVAAVASAENNDTMHRKRREVKRRQRLYKRLTHPLQTDIRADSQEPIAAEGKLTTDRIQECKYVQQIPTCDSLLHKHTMFYFVFKKSVLSWFDRIYLTVYWLFALVFPYFESKGKSLHQSDRCNPTLPIAVHKRKRRRRKRRRH